MSGSTPNALRIPSGIPIPELGGELGGGKGCWKEVVDLSSDALMANNRFNFLDGIRWSQSRESQRIASDGERFSQQMQAVSRFTPEMKQTQSSY